MWNYRVLKVGKTSFEIREAYYNKDGSIFAITKDASSPFGETKKQLKRDLKAMLRALDKPTLKDGKIKFVPHESATKIRKEKKECQLNRIL